MKLSIIVPVFNLEKYIEKCLDSLLDQDLSVDQYEILVINDGSTDNTELILNNYSEKFKNISIFCKENEGVSIARNLGIRNSCGEFILFVDGDDWMCKNVLNKIYQDVKINELEIARFGHVRVLGKNYPNQEIILPRTEKPIKGMTFVVENEIKDFYPWLFVLSNSFIKKNNLQFNPDLSFCEDKEFMLKALYLSNRFQNFNYSHYYYRTIREGAASSSFSNNHLIDSLNSILSIYQFATAQNKSNIFQDYLKLSSVRSLEKSYYKLTLDSFYSKFLVWSDYLKKNEIFINSICKYSFKLSLLKNNSFLFYSFYYFPRALYHKLTYKLIN